MTDAELVRRIRDGDAVAREVLVRRWSPRVLAVCRARIGHHHAAEDAAQETLLRGLTKLNELADPDKLGAWLRGIAVNVCADWQRGRSRDPVSRKAVSFEGVDQRFASQDRLDTQSNRLDQDERRTQLKAEIDALPAELREPLLLFYFDEIGYEEIARVLGISRATVNARLAKARQQLAKRLAPLLK